MGAKLPQIARWLTSNTTRGGVRLHARLHRPGRIQRESFISFRYPPSASELKDRLERDTATLNLFLKDCRDALQSSIIAGRALLISPRIQTLLEPGDQEGCEDNSIVPFSNYSNTNRPTRRPVPQKSPLPLTRTMITGRSTTTQILGRIRAGWLSTLSLTALKTLKHKVREKQQVILFFSHRQLWHTVVYTSCLTKVWSQQFSVFQTRDVCSKA